MFYSKHMTQYPDKWRKNENPRFKNWEISLRKTFRKSRN